MLNTITVEEIIRFLKESGLSNECQTVIADQERLAKAFKSFLDNYEEPEEVRND